MRRITPCGSPERLWALARELPVETVPIASIAELDADCWFGPGRVPTVRAVAAHARRIADADVAWPIILSADERLMDGGHRIAKAWLAGETHVRAVRFVEDPAPDYAMREGVGWAVEEGVGRGGGRRLAGSVFGSRACGESRWVDATATIATTMPPGGHAGRLQ